MIKPFESLPFAASSQRGVASLRTRAVLESLLVVAPPKAFVYLKRYTAALVRDEDSGIERTEAQTMEDGQVGVYICC